MLRVALVAGLAVVVALAALAWGTWPRAGVGEMLLPAKTSFAKGHYSAYAQPWGGELVRWTKRWSPHADAMLLHVKHFPAQTEMTWRWPPKAPTFGPGVWGYDSVSYGNYAGGLPEKPVPKIRVRDLKALAQRFDWTIHNGWGDGNVLTEFFLRTSTTDVEAQRLEVGWLLHMPASTRAYFDGSKLIGDYVDERGRHWTVRLSDKYCMFAPDKPVDVRAGAIDMLRALRWLQTKKLVRGDEWLWGVGIGVEPVTGYGRLMLNDWQVVMN